MLDQISQECFEELKGSIKVDIGMPWLTIIRKHMARIPRPPEAGPETHQCSVCHDPASERGGFDEDGSFWCVDCMKRWEQQHGEHWANGQPF